MLLLSLKKLQRQQLVNLEIQISKTKLVMKNIDPWCEQLVFSNKSNVWSFHIFLKLKLTVILLIILTTSSVPNKYSDVLHPRFYSAKMVFKI